MTTTLEPHVARRSWAALGTTCTVLVTDRAALEPACAAVAAVLELADATYSRFRADSELSRLNEAGRPMVISPLLAEALEAALRAARLTDGAVDPTVGRAMRALGYGADFATLAGRDVPLELRLEAVPGWQAIGYQGTARRVTLPRGIELDLGSVGKALAADHAAAAAHRVAGAGVLVSLGGDIATAGAGPVPGWPILVADDSGAPADGPGEVVRITSGALATSSTTVRRLDPGWRPAPPPGRPGHRQAGRQPVAHGDRGRRLVRRCQYGRHGGHRQGRPGTRLAGRGRPADAPRGGRRAPAAPQPLADAGGRWRHERPAAVVRHAGRGHRLAAHVHRGGRPGGAQRQSLAGAVVAPLPDGRPAPQPVAAGARLPRPSTS